MINGPQPLNTRVAEQMFGRKASPDTQLSPKQFIKKEIKSVGDEAHKAFHAATQFGEHLKDVAVADVGKVVRKITGPTVRNMKAEAATDQARRQKAESGEYNR